MGYLGISFYLSRFNKFKILNYSTNKQAIIKKVTPTAGGLVILPLILYSNYNLFEWWMMPLIISGLIDDYMAHINKKSDGLSNKCQLFFILTSIFINYYYYYLNITQTVFQYITILSVNVSDGFDGFITTISIMYLVFLNKYHSLICILSSFLYFNLPPAKLYIGNIGSNLLGCLLSKIALENDISIFIVITNSFYLEWLSSLIQIISLRYFDTRVFPMAPIHHTIFKYNINEEQLLISILLWTYCLYKLVF